MDIDTTALDLALPDLAELYELLSPHQLSILLNDSSFVGELDLSSLSKAELLQLINEAKSYKTVLSGGVVEIATIQTVLSLAGQLAQKVLHALGSQPN